MSALFRVLTLIALLLALAVIPDRVAMAVDNRCEFGIRIRPLTECEWQEVSPRPVDTDPCAPLTLIGTNGDNSLYGNGGDDVIRGKAGNDELYGDGGNDVLRGGPDDDDRAVVRATTPTRAARTPTASCLRPGERATRSSRILIRVFRGATTSCSKLVVSLRQKGPSLLSIQRKIIAVRIGK